MNIELAGASGVGKTTALSHISEVLYSSLQVASGDLLLELMRDAEKQASNLHYTALADEGVVFLRDDFISEYLNRIQQMNGKDSQKINLVKFIDKHRKDFLVRQQLDVKHLLIDEGLVHASFPLSQFSANLAQDVAFFFDNIPFPSVVIQLHAKPERILKRIKARGKTVNSYRYADDAVLLRRLGNVERYLALMEQALSRRGCRVRHINANGPVKEWSQAIMDTVSEEISHQTSGLQNAVALNFNKASLSEKALGLDFSLPEDRHTS